MTEMENIKETEEKAEMLSEDNEKPSQKKKESKDEKKKPDYDRLVTVTLPRDNSERKAKSMRITLNGKPIIVPRGEMVEIPYRYYLLLRKKNAFREMDDDYKAELEKKLAEINK